MQVEGVAEAYTVDEGFAGHVGERHDVLDAGFGEVDHSAERLVAARECEDSGDLVSDALRAGLDAERNQSGRCFLIPSDERVERYVRGGDLRVRCLAGRSGSERCPV